MTEGVDFSVILTGTLASFPTQKSQVIFSVKAYTWKWVVIDDLIYTVGHAEIEESLDYILLPDDHLSR